MDELKNNLDLEEMDYYYHITSKGFGSEIFENGLYMESPDIKSTTIKITQDIVDDLESYCEEEFEDNLVKRQEMVIIGCAKGEETYLVERCDVPRITESQRLNYYISPENILCYIDLESLNVIYNPEYIHNYTI